MGDVELLDLADFNGSSSLAARSPISAKLYDLAK